MYILVMFTEHVYIQDPHLMKALVKRYAVTKYILHTILMRNYMYKWILQVIVHKGIVRHKEPIG